MKIYFGNCTYNPGSSKKNLEELYNEKKIISEPEVLKQQGFLYNAIAGEDENVLDLIIPTLREIKKNNYRFTNVFHDTCLYLGEILSDTIDISKRQDIVNYMDYIGAKITQDLNQVDTKYYGISQQGCSGMFSLMEIANNFSRYNEESQYQLCLTADVLGDQIFYDRGKVKILFSDCASALVVSNEPLEYEIIDIENRSYADLTINRFKQMSIITNLLKSILEKNNINKNDIENIFIQNCWTEFWQAVLTNVIGDYSKMSQDLLPDYGHAFSSDFIINLNSREEKNIVTPGAVQIAIGYGFGLHSSCLVFKKL